MICIDGEVIKSADDVCDGCRRTDCVLMEQLRQMWEVDQTMQQVEVRACELFEELLP